MLVARLEHIAAKLRERDGGAARRESAGGNKEIPNRSGEWDFASC